MRVGGLGACPPHTGFFFQILPNEKWCSFSRYAYSWDALYLFQSCGIIFMGAGGMWGHPPDFIFNFCKMLKGVFSHYTCSWDALYLFQCSGIISMWGSGGVEGGLGACPLISCLIFAKLKNVFSHITHGHGMHCTFSSPVVSFSCGGLGAAWGGGGLRASPLDFILNFCIMKNGVFSYYACSWDALHLFQSSGIIIM